MFRTLRSQFHLIMRMFRTFCHLEPNILPILKMLPLPCKRFKSAQSLDLLQASLWAKNGRRNRSHSLVILGSLGRWLDRILSSRHPFTKNQYPIICLERENDTTERGFGMFFDNGRLKLGTYPLLHLWKLSYRGRYTVVKKNWFYFVHSYRTQMLQFSLSSKLFPRSLVNM